MEFQRFPVKPPVIPDNTIEQNKIISPYFEEGLFAGVRVTADNEDFVIDPNDYRNGLCTTWTRAMCDLSTYNLTMWNFHQMSLVIYYHDEINKVLVNYGKDKLRELYWTCEESPFDEEYAFCGNFDNGSNYINEVYKQYYRYVRPIKNLKN